jgi:hypothetical protein
MKTHIVIAFALFLSIAPSANELSWVDTQVEAIKPARKGMNDSELTNIKDPFIFFGKRTKQKYTKSKKKTVMHSITKKSTTSSDSTSIIILHQPSKPLILSAIINNSALINGEWYKINESVDSFKLSSISRTNVVLTKGNEKLVLTTSDTKRNLKFK